ncbi:hypothetical protein CCP3SC15_710007 [Gammaproteobacteria bacterium]
MSIAARTHWPSLGSAYWIRKSIRVTFEERELPPEKMVDDKDWNKVMRRFVVVITAAADVTAASVENSALADYMDPEKKDWHPDLMTAGDDPSPPPGDYILESFSADDGPSGKTTATASWKMTGPWKIVTIADEELT